MSFLDAVKDGVFTVPGDEEGCIDFPACAVIKKLITKGWMVVEAEQVQPGPIRWNMRY